LSCLKFLPLAMCFSFKAYSRYFCTAWLSDVIISQMYGSWHSHDKKYFNYIHIPWCFIICLGRFQVGHCINVASPKYIPAHYKVDVLTYIYPGTIVPDASSNSCLPLPFYTFHSIGHCVQFLLDICILLKTDDFIYEIPVTLGRRHFVQSTQIRS